VVDQWFRRTSLAAGLRSHQGVSRSGATTSPLSRSGIPQRYERAFAELAVAAVP